MDHEGEIYIVESESIAAYLRQLQALGNGWRIIVRCGIILKGARNPVLPLFEYPEPRIEITGDFTNLKLIRDQASPLVSSNSQCPRCVLPVCADSETVHDQLVHVPVFR